MNWLHLITGRSKNDSHNKNDSYNTDTTQNQMQYKLQSTFVIAEYEKYLSNKEKLQVKQPNNIDFSKNEFILEANHLKMTIKDIDENICIKNNSIETTEDTWWMDRDQKLFELRKREKNAKIYSVSEELNELRYSPYFARIDVSSEKYKNETFYIGEKAYSFNKTDIYSVWSDFGRYYRNKKLLNFEVAGIDYTVKLRRHLDIRDGQLFDYADEFKFGSTESRSNITDPFLIEVLKRKRAEKHLTNIISTIQQKQNEIIDYDFYKSIIVQGCAGSGKTMILLHRLANMKFNELKYDFNRVKIITPNDNFNLFIDGLSENLGISGITKTTLSGYYISLIGRYYVDIAGNRNSGYERVKFEKRLLFDEGEVPIELRKIIYSEQFFLKVSSAIKKIRDEDLTKAKNNRHNIGDLIGRLPYIPKGEVILERVDLYSESKKSVVEDLLIKTNIKIDLKKNYACILYLKTLVLYLYFGALPISYDTLLCIDEAQDIASMQFELLKRVNGKSLKFNIYGDINQQIEGNVNVGGWEAIKDKCGAHVFNLRENYRNSENIVKFYNTELGFSDVPFGLQTRTVTIITKEQINYIIELNLEYENRTAIISMNKQKLSQFLNDNSAVGKVIKDKVSLLTVKEAKGLEFDTAVVLLEGMSKNEKYIAFTRALNDLFIIF